MNKRLVSVLLCFVFMLSLFTGCSDSKKPSNPNPDNSSSSSTTSADDTSSDNSSSDNSSSDSSLSYSETKNTTEKISVPATAQLTFAALPAENSVLLNSNPDRGWRSEEDYVVPDISKLRNEPQNYTYEKLYSRIKNDISINTVSESVTVSRVYFIMYNYKNEKNIPDEAIEYINTVCKVYKDLGIKMYLGFYYMHYRTDYTGVSEAIRGGARKSTIIYHVKNYYSKIWEKWEEAIYSVGVNLFGHYGEWTSLGDTPLDDGVSRADLTAEEYQKQVNEGLTEVVELVLDTVPKALYINMRQPYWKTMLLSKDHPRYNRVGYACDAFFGKIYPDADMGQSYWRPGNYGGYWDVGMKEAPYAVMDAELFTSRYFKDESNAYVDAYSSIETMSELRLSTFSANHSYGDMSMHGVPIEQTILYGWKCEEVTPKILDNIGVHYSNAWFTDKDGGNVQRNAFEYIRDHLGYRFSAKNLSVTGGTKAGSKIKLNMNLQNYGMATGHNLSSYFVILDENNNVISKVQAGNPEDWHPTNPADYTDRTLLVHNVNASMTLPNKTGTYKIAFLITNKLGQTARLDNLIEYSDGYNILHMFTID